MATGPAAREATIVRGRTARFTKTDACGMPLATSATFVSNGLVSVAAAKNMDEGSEISQRGIDGSLAVYEPGKKSLQNFDIDIVFWKFNAALFAGITGDALVLDYNGTAVGWEERERITFDSPVAFELWTQTAAQACSGGAALSGYLLYPLLTGAWLEIADIEDGAINGTIHATSRVNPLWGKGPYNVVAADASNTPGRLISPVDARTHRHFEITPVAAPVPTDGTLGWQALTLPTPY